MRRVRNIIDIEYILPILIIMNLNNKQTSCPVKRLRSYKNNSELFLAWVKVIVLEKLGFGKSDYSIYTRRSMQKAFLSWVIDLYKWWVNSNNWTLRWELIESKLSLFWKDALLRSNRESKIEEINKVIWEFQNAIEEHRYRSEKGIYGKVSTFNTRFLSLINAIPNGRDEFGLITNITLIVLIAFRMHYKEQDIENNESERIKLLQITNSVLGSFLVLQKREFNNASLAFMKNIDIDESWKQILPIEFIWTDIENPKWQFTQWFKDSTQNLMTTDEYKEFWYTDMITSCPAAQNWILPLLTKKIFNILYEGPRSENKSSAA